MTKPPWRSSQGAAARVTLQDRADIEIDDVLDMLVARLQRRHPPEHQPGIVDQPVDAAEMSAPSR